MSSKAYRKLLKEKAEKEENVQEAPAKVAIPERATKNVFQMMMMCDDSDDGAQEEDDRNDGKADGKAAEEEITEKESPEEEKHPQESSEKAAAKKKRKKKKNKQKRDLHDVLEDQEKDDKSDEEEIELEFTQTSKRPFKSDALEINVKNFNYNKELDKYFKGEKLVEDADICNLV